MRFKVNHIQLELLVSARGRGQMHRPLPPLWIVQIGIDLSIGI